MLFMVRWVTVVQVRGEELVAAVEAVYRGLASRQYDAPMVPCHSTPTKV